LSRNSGHKACGLSFAADGRTHGEVSVNPAVNKLWHVKFGYTSCVAGVTGSPVLYLSEKLPNAIGGPMIAPAWLVAAAVG